MRCACAPPRILRISCTAAIEGIDIAFVVPEEDPIDDSIALKDEVSNTLAASDRFEGIRVLNEEDRNNVRPGIVRRMSNERRSIRSLGKVGNPDSVGFGLAFRESV